MVKLNLRPLNALVDSCSFFFLSIYLFSTIFLFTLFHVIYQVKRYLLMCMGVCSCVCVSVCGCSWVYVGMYGCAWVYLDTIFIWHLTTGRERPRYPHLLSILGQFHTCNNYTSIGIKLPEVKLSVLWGKIISVLV